MLRTNLREVGAIAVVALVPALVGTGVLDREVFSGFLSMGHDLRRAVEGVFGRADGARTAEPAKRRAGPTCVLVAADGHVLGLDREGCIASCDTASTCTDLPVFTGFVPDKMTVGENLSVAEVVVGLAILKALEARPELMKALSELNLADLANPKAILCKGVVVNLGAGDYKRKVERLGQVLATLRQLEESPKTIDLRFARQVVVTCSKPSGTKKDKEV